MSVRAFSPELRVPHAHRMLGPLAVAATVPVGWAVVEMQIVVGLAAATILCLPLLVSPRLRVLWVTFGTLTFFGTTDELTAGKLAFLYGVGFALAGSLFHTRALKRTATYSLLTPLFWASGAFGLLAGTSLVASVLHQTPQTDWLRDIAPYVLFAAAPLLALDAYRAFSTRSLELILGAAGIVAALSFGVKWITVRGIADLSALPAGFPSTLLAAALGTYATAKLLSGDGRRYVWLLLAAVTFSLLFATGTRTTLIVLVAPFVITLGSAGGLGVRVMRLLVLLPLLALAVFMSLQSIVRVSDGDAQVLQQRISLLLSSGATTDLSYRDRLTQAEVATRAFRESPIVGVGPGRGFVWYDTFGERFLSQSIDTPIAFLAKFGVLGLLWLGVVALAYARFYRALRRRSREPAAAELALLAYAAVVVGYAVLQVPLEDKGLAPAMLLLVALAMRGSPAPRVGSRPAAADEAFG